MAAMCITRAAASAVLGALAAAGAASASPLSDVAIVGAGPAGLAQAIAIRKLVGDDVRVRVFDRSDQLRPALGGGVQLSSGAAVLARLGLGDALEVTGQPAAVVHSRNVDGDTLLRLDLHAAIRAHPRAHAAGAVRSPSDAVMAFTIMRDALQDLLAAYVPEGALILDAPVATAHPSPRGGCDLVFADGSSARFDLVIGADGIRSAVRDAVVGSAASEGPAYTGIQIRWGIAPGGTRSASQAGELHQWFGRGAYCLAATYGGRGGQQFDQCVVVSADSSMGGAYNPLAASVNAAWDTSEVRDDMLRRLQAARMPADVESLAGACERCFALGAHQHNPLRSWVGCGGAAVLIGDAAHAMPPFLGQGANQAVQDAYALAIELARFRSGGHADLASALRAYEASRKLDVARLAFNSRMLGLVETALPDVLRDAFFRTMAATGVARAVFLDGAISKVT